MFVYCSWRHIWKICLCVSKCLAIPALREMSSSAGGRLCHSAEGRVWSMECCSHAAVYSAGWGLGSLFRSVHSVTRKHRYNKTYIQANTLVLTGDHFTVAGVGHKFLLLLHRQSRCLDIALHFWRLPLHILGECGAWPARGVQFEVLFVSILNTHFDDFLNHWHSFSIKKLSPVFRFHIFCL